MDALSSAREVIAARGLATGETPVLLMVSGGSDSTALAYIAAELIRAGDIGPVAMLHVNHKLRGADADDDALFAAQLADALGIPLFACEINVSGIAAAEGGNIEAVARRERYAAAHDALVSLCRHVGAPVSEGRIFTAHTADDRVENFYMRSIVGTGPGGFRAMRYLNGQVARPLLEVGRQDLRDYLQERADSNQLVVRDGQGALWRDDATNEHTDRFRAFVRAEIVPDAKERNPRLLQTLTHTMNLIADEDEMLESYVDRLMASTVEWESVRPGADPDYVDGCLVLPVFAHEPRPIQRRLVTRVLTLILGAEARIEGSSVEAVLGAVETEVAGDGKAATGIKGGYVANIQGDLAVSANKRGVRIEPMAVFRARRKRL